MKLWHVLLICAALIFFGQTPPSNGTVAERGEASGPVSYVVGVTLDQTVKKAGTDWNEVQQWVKKVGILLGTRPMQKRPEQYALNLAGGCPGGVCEIPNAVKSQSAPAGSGVARKAAAGPVRGVAQAGRGAVRRVGVAVRRVGGVFRRRCR
jgi:hypothetical protein